MANHFRSSDQYEKNFVGIVDSLTGSLQKWQVWEYLITAMACSISGRASASSGMLHSQHHGPQQGAGSRARKAV